MYESALRWCELRTAESLLVVVQSYTVSVRASKIEIAIRQITQIVKPPVRLVSVLVVWAAPRSGLVRKLKNYQQIFTDSFCIRTGSRSDRVVSQNSTLTQRPGRYGSRF